MIWATVSSQSCFCWLYRVSPSSPAKNKINLILILTVWWCMCKVISCPVGRGCLLWSVCFLSKTVSLCPAPVCTQNLQIGKTKFLFTFGLSVQYCHHNPGKGYAGLVLWVALSISVLICPKHVSDNSHHSFQGAKQSKPPSVQTRGILGARDVYHNNDSLHHVEFDIYRAFINITTFHLHNSPVRRFCYFRFSVEKRESQRW